MKDYYYYYIGESLKGVTKKVFQGYDPRTLPPTRVLDMPLISNTIKSIFLSTQ